MKYILIFFVMICSVSCSVQENLAVPNLSKMKAEGDTTLIRKYCDYLDNSDSSIGSFIVDGTNNSISGAFSDPLGSSPVSTGGATVGGFTLTERSSEVGYGYQIDDNNISNLFGTTISFSTVGGYYTSFNGNLTVSNKIDFITPVQTKNDSPSTRIIYRNLGKTITWNADQNNNMGVSIRIDFDPHNDPLMNSTLKNATSVSRLIIVPDNGSYNISTNNLNGIPNNADITVSIARLNYKVLKNSSNNKIIASAISHSKLLFKVND